MLIIQFPTQAPTMVRNALPFYNDGEPDTKDNLTY